MTLHEFHERNRAEIEQAHREGWPESADFMPFHFSDDWREQQPEPVDPLQQNVRRVQRTWNEGRFDPIPFGRSSVDEHEEIRVRIGE